MGRALRTAAIVVVIAGLGTGLFLLGRQTSNTGGAHDRGHAAGYSSGLRHGEARGLEQGRAFQATLAVPKDAKAAARAEFSSGYAAGANDGFSGYDGGWYVASPYLVTLARGSGSITYDISSRSMLIADVDYFLCPHAHTVCHRPHR